MRNEKTLTQLFHEAAWPETPRWEGTSADWQGRVERGVAAIRERVLAESEPMSLLKRLATVLHRVNFEAKDPERQTEARNVVNDLRTYLEGLDHTECAPCPYPTCSGGKIDIFDTHDRRFCVRCHGCDARGPVASTRLAAVEAWDGLTRK